MNGDDCLRYSGDIRGGVTKTYIIGLSDVGDLEISGLAFWDGGSGIGIAHG